MQSSTATNGQSVSSGTNATSDAAATASSKTTKEKAIAKAQQEIAENEKKLKEVERDEKKLRQQLKGATAKAFPCDDADVPDDDTLRNRLTGRPKGTAIDAIPEACNDLLYIWDFVSRFASEQVVDFSANSCGEALMLNEVKNEHDEVIATLNSIASSMDSDIDPAVSSDARQQSLATGASSSVDPIIHPKATTPTEVSLESFAGIMCSNLWHAWVLQTRLHMSLLRLILLDMAGGRGGRGGGDDNDNDDLDFDDEETLPQIGMLSPHTWPQVSPAPCSSSPPPSVSPAQSTAHRPAASAAC